MMFSFNDDLRHAECRLVFKVDELSRLAAEAINQSPDDIVCLEKLADTGDKGQNTQQIHAEHIENTDNMCLQYVQ